MSKPNESELIPVVFRKDLPADGGAVFALFPTVPSDPAGYYCLSFQHVGQHSGADPHACINNSHPARPHEYADLLRELQSPPYNYRLVVIQRIMPALHNKRMAVAREQLARRRAGVGQ